MTVMREIRLSVVMDDWTRPEPGTMEVDLVAGIIRVWLRNGEMVIPRGVTVEAMTRLIQAAEDGTLGEAVSREHQENRPAGITLRNGSSFRIAAGAIRDELA
jgi:hypothetical protein